MSNILHALSLTFTTRACGARAKNCAISIGSARGPVTAGPQHEGLRPRRTLGIAPDGDRYACPDRATRDAESCVKARGTERAWPIVQRSRTRGAHQGGRKLGTRVDRSTDERPPPYYYASQMTSIFNSIPHLMFNSTVDKKKWIQKDK